MGPKRNCAQILGSLRKAVVNFIWECRVTPAKVGAPRPEVKPNMSVSNETNYEYSTHFHPQILSSVLGLKYTRARRVFLVAVSLTCFFLIREIIKWWRRYLWTEINNKQNPWNYPKSFISQLSNLLLISAWLIFWPNKLSFVIPSVSREFLISYERDPETREDRW